jgi:hypothetical protein
VPCPPDCCWQTCQVANTTEPLDPNDPGADDLLEWDDIPTPEQQYACNAQLMECLDPNAGPLDCSDLDTPPPVDADASLPAAPCPVPSYRLDERFGDG